MKKRFALVVLVIFALLSIAAVPAPAAVKLPQYEVTTYTLVIDGQSQALAKPILLKNDRSMLPMRSFFEGLGATVTWDDATKTALATKGDFTVTFPIGSNVISVCGKQTWIDVPAMLVSDSTYVPVRAAAEALGYGVTFNNGVITLTTGGQSDQPSLVGVDYTNTSFDRTWFESDRKHLADLLAKGNADSIKSLIYAEYLGLSEEMKQLYASAYHSPRGYILFSPVLSDQINTVWTAMRARTSLLEDILKGRVENIDKYYPQSYTYQFVRQQSLSITPTASFPGFNQAELAAFIDGLDIPDYYLIGLKIFFVAGKPNASQAGVNYNTTIRGFYDTNIVVYNWGQPLNDIKGVVAHEIGHNVAHEIFYNWTDEVQTKADITNQTEYASLYNKPVPGLMVPWGDDLDENFADDFAYIHVDNYHKLANWKGVSKDKLASFINAKVAAKNVDDVPLFREINIDLDAGTIPFLGDAIETLDSNTRYLVTTKDRLTLKLVECKGQFYVLFNNTLYKFENGEVTLPLPTANSLYTLRIGTSADGRYLDSIVYYFSVLRIVQN